VDRGAISESLERVQDAIAGLLGSLFFPACAREVFRGHFSKAPRVLGERFLQVVQDLICVGRSRGRGFRAQCANPVIQSAGGHKATVPGESTLFQSGVSGNSPSRSVAI
jgi:hypothetical protein